MVQEYCEWWFLELENECSLNQCRNKKKNTYLEYSTDIFTSLKKMFDDHIF